MNNLQYKDFSIETIISSVSDLKAGATVSFIGSVRCEDELKALQYETYDEMAIKVLKQIREAAIEKFGLIKAEIVHRKGQIKIGEKVVIIACSAPHREEAFRACEWIISEIKKSVPIWKKEI